MSKVTEDSNSVKLVRVGLTCGFIGFAGGGFVAGLSALIRSPSSGIHLKLRNGWKHACEVAPKKARNFASIGMGYVMIENSLAGVRKKKDDWNSAVSLSTALLIGQGTNPAMRLAITSAACLGVVKTLSLSEALSNVGFGAWSTYLGLGGLFAVAEGVLKSSSGNRVADGLKNASNNLAAVVVVFTLVYSLYYLVENKKREQNEILLKNKALQKKNESDANLEDNTLKLPIYDEKPPTIVEEVIEKDKLPIKDLGSHE